MKQRWALIESGTSASSFKIRDSKLYVGESIYGIADGPIFSAANQTDIGVQSKSPLQVTSLLHQRTVSHQIND